MKYQYKLLSDRLKALSKQIKKVTDKDKENLTAEILKDVETVTAGLERLVEVADARLREMGFEEKDEAR